MSMDLASASFDHGRVHEEQLYTPSSSYEE